VTSELLVATDLAMARGTRRLFREVSINLGSSEALHLTGANGSGKTTLLRILCGLTEADSGQVRWQGTKIQSEPDAFRGELAYLSHHNALYPNLTVRENLALTPELARNPEQLEQVLGELNLSAHADLPAKLLSQGQRRRAAFCRVVLKQATLWVLDEPFTGLDVGSCTLLEQILQKHLSQGGTLIFTTHQPLSLLKPTQTLVLESTPS